MSRHGTKGGAMAHYRRGESACAPCRAAANRAGKLNKYRRHQGDPGRIPHEEVLRVVQPWLDQGFTATAIYRAAGVGRDYGGDALTVGRSALRSTFKALQNLTEDAFLDGDEVFADLTRTRIYSLRAAGHLLSDMPILPNGVWRTASRITARDARAIRAHFRTNEATLGTNKNGAARARNQGHLPPLAWDDPGTLAWPDGAPAPRQDRDKFRQTDLDPAIVDRVLSGDRRPRKLTNAEAAEVVRRALSAGMSTTAIERTYGLNTARYKEAS